MSLERVPYNKFRPVYPTPAGLVTSVAPDGKPNIITLGEIINLSIREPVIVGIAIAPQRYSHELISRQGEFVVNLPTADLMPKVWGCGRTSGRNVDKFAEFGLTPLPATHVKPPLIAECPVNIECRVIGIETIGDHDLFKGEVLEVHVDPDLLDENGRIDPDKLDTIVMTSWGFFRLGPRITDLSVG